MKQETYKKYALRGVSAVAFMLTALQMKFYGRMPFMSTSWSGFKNSMVEFFENGLGGADGGMGGVGIVLVVIGVISAGISFAVHKFNPQSRMPGWITCLAVGLIGALVMGGISTPLKILEQGRTLVYSWFGM